MKEYFSRHTRLFLGGGGVALAMAILVLLVAPNPPLSLFASAAMLLSMGFKLKNTPLVRLGFGRIEVKAGPFATKKIVAFGEIDRVDASNPKIIVLYTAAGPVRIPAGALEEYQRREILGELGGPS